MPPHGASSGTSPTNASRGRAVPVDSATSTDVRRTAAVEERLAEGPRPAPAERSSIQARGGMNTDLFAIGSPLAVQLLPWLLGAVSAACAAAAVQRRRTATD
jgi:hypothetical protein